MTAPWYLWGAFLLVVAIAVTPAASADEDSVVLENAAIDIKLRGLLEALLLKGTGSIPARTGTVNDTRKGTRNVVINNGYLPEEHTVQTDDGYLLTLFRLARPGSPVVFIMHGLLSSSADFVVLGRGRALAFLLYEAGFDVWLGNARGNTASRRHITLSPSQPEFWDFSWHEIGVSDLPASIDYVLTATKQSALHYIGHSQGTTAFFVLGSERPEYMAKVKTFIALAPIAFVRDIRSIPLRLLFPDLLSLVRQLIGFDEFLPSDGLIQWLGDNFCKADDVTQPLCYEILFLIGGTDSQQINKTMLPDFLVNTPAGSATKQFVHYGQLVHQRSLEFRRYDYGVIGNLERYGRLSAPAYDLSRVTADTFLIQAPNDLLAVESNLAELVRRLPNINRVSRVRFDSFTHLDFIIAKDAKELLYDDVIGIVQAQEKKAQGAQRQSPIAG